MDTAGWLSLALICIAGAVTPGPSLLVILNIGRLSGQRAGYAAAVGHGVGVFCYAVAAATGLAVVARQFPIGFMAVQALGAVFLTFLAVRLILGEAASAEGATRHRDTSLARSFLGGFLIAVLNPKIALFFASLFSGFISSGQTHALHLTMAGLAGGIDMAVYLGYVLLVGHARVGRFMRAKTRILDLILAFMFIAIAGVIGVETVQALLAG
jgi:threonine/homoserine/homoserine lactone efflux protein